MSTQNRYRTVIPNVGAAAFTVLAVAQSPPQRGCVARVRVTIDPAVDADASPGTTGATDIAAQLWEATAGATPMGGTAAKSIPLAYGFTPLDPAVTIDSGESTHYQVPSGSALAFAVKTDVDGGGLANATAVVTIDIIAG